MSDQVHKRLDLGIDYKSTYAWIKTGRGKLALCPKPCSQDIAKALLASLDPRELLPPVDLVLATPILAEREGRLEPLGRGYHERERLLITNGELPLPVELDAAVRSLQDLLSDFLFPTPGDRSRALVGSAGFGGGAMIAGKTLTDGDRRDRGSQGVLARQAPPLRDTSWWPRFGSTRFGTNSFPAEQQRSWRLLVEKLAWRSAY